MKDKKSKVFKRHQLIYEALDGMLFNDHPRIWDKLMVCKVRMDGVYFRMLCAYLYHYIVAGTIISFQNPIMQATIVELRRMVDNEITDVVIKNKRIR